MEDLDPRFIAFVYAKRGMGRVDWLALWMAEARVDYRLDHLFQATHYKPTCPVCPPSLWPPFGLRDIDRLI